MESILFKFYTPSLWDKLENITIIDKIGNHQLEELISKFNWKSIILWNEHKNKSIKVVFYDSKIVFDHNSIGDDIILCNNQISEDVIKEMGYDIVYKYSYLLHSKVDIDAIFITDIYKFSKYFVAKEDQNVVIEITIKFDIINLKVTHSEKYLNIILTSFPNLKEITWNLSWRGTILPSDNCIKSILSRGVKLNFSNFWYNLKSGELYFKIQSNVMYLITDYKKGVEFRWLKLKTNSEFYVRWSRFMQLKNFIAFKTWLFSKVEVSKIFSSTIINDSEVNDLTNNIDLKFTNIKNLLMIPLNKFSWLEINWSYFINKENKQKLPNFIDSKIIKLNNKAKFRIRFKDISEIEQWKNLIQTIKIRNFWIIPKNWLEAIELLSSIITNLPVESILIYVCCDFKVSIELQHLLKRNSWIDILLIYSQ